MVHYVYSTITNDTSYPEYKKTGNDIQTVVKQVTIKGGAHRGGKGLITPFGVSTKVTDEELAFLENHPAFKRHKERGFLKVVKTEKNVEAVVGDMAHNDKSKQLSAGDFPEGEAPKVGTVETEKKGGKIRK